jgi:hypothetical protein
LRLISGGLDLCKVRDKYAFPESAARKSLEDALAKAMTDLFNDPAFIAALTATTPAQAAAN